MAEAGLQFPFDREYLTKIISNGKDIAGKTTEHKRKESIKKKIEIYEQMRDHFGLIDTDGDNIVDQREFRAFCPEKNIPTQEDIDRLTKELTQEDLKKYAIKLKEKAKEKGISQGEHIRLLELALVYEQMAENKTFDRIDRNGNRGISRNEFNAFCAHGTDNSKPTQEAVAKINSNGITPDMFWTHLCMRARNSTLDYNDYDKALRYYMYDKRMNLGGSIFEAKDIDFTSRFQPHQARHNGAELLINFIMLLDQSDTYRITKEKLDKINELGLSSFILSKDLAKKPYEIVECLVLKEAINNCTKKYHEITCINLTAEYKILKEKYQKLIDFALNIQIRNCREREIYSQTYSSTLNQDAPFKLLDTRENGIIEINEVFNFITGRKGFELRELYKR